MVGESGRATNSVAPNSPSDTATAKPNPTVNARSAIGRSTSRHTRLGDAPSTAAASRRRGSIERNAGTTARITNGIATTDWAMGTRIVLARRSRGQRSSATRKPKPTVTADVPSGSINSVSIARVARPGREAITTDAKPPMNTAIHAASAAKPSEFTSASEAGTKSVSVDALLPRAR